ncbi:PREDICTED: uncharacterized protein LOC106121974 [Papilio xuthus]|uniref:Uncharacterized protein LOC106121974 n=1 Tax=Papilio xuthus TaxID=66420 RepID=A0AAJ6ZII7_PAPXU|nr:PREDICTED: uncharacterized protein LOC106121974 [Papilio xuthus]
MDKVVLFLVISLFLSSNADGKSWYRYDTSDHYNDRIIFEDYTDTRNNNNFGGLEHHHSQSGVGHKYPKDWNPDRIWFPDSDNEDREITTKSTTDLPRLVTTISSRENYDECIKGCPTTSEYNPVCGTNRITYSNIGHLECARLCGLDVKLYRKLPCTTTETTIYPTTTTESDSQRRCIASCPTTPEYNPVCGTNNVTYQNIGKLECAKYCGIDVELKRLSPCPKPITTPPPNGDDFFNSVDQPSWTSNIDGNIFRPATKPPHTTITISQDILNNVFNVPTPEPNEYDFDVRFKE